MNGRERSLTWSRTPWRCGGKWFTPRLGRRAPTACVHENYPWQFVWDSIRVMRSEPLFWWMDSIFGQPMMGSNIKCLHTPVCSSSPLLLPSCDFSSNINRISKPLINMWSPTHKNWNLVISSSLYYHWSNRIYNIDVSVTSYNTDEQINKQHQLILENPTKPSRLHASAMKQNLVYRKTPFLLCTTSSCTWSLILGYLSTYPPDWAAKSHCSRDQSSKCWVSIRKKVSQLYSIE
jgi:hypothetical protein